MSIGEKIQRRFTEAHENLNFMFCAIPRIETTKNLMFNALGIAYSRNLP
jgi:hypothetical protein